MSIQEIASSNTLNKISISRAQAEPADQYTLWQIIAIWALAAVPMALVTWVIAPAIIPYSPLHPGITFWLLMIGGMEWEFVVSLVIIYRELGTLRWSAIRQRTWLQTPRDPRTNQPNAKLFWWLLPALFFSGLVNLALAGYLDAPMAWLFPSLKPAPFTEMSQLATRAFQGQWWILGIALVSFVFNYFLGEEFLFRGLIQNALTRAIGRAGLPIAAVIFGFAHLPDPRYVVLAALAGVAYGWVYQRTGRITASAVTHAFVDWIWVMLLRG